MHSQILGAAIDGQSNWFVISFDGGGGAPTGVDSEMVLGSYIPTWAPVTMGNGPETHAIAFVADTTREQYASDSCVTTVAPLVARAAGKFGSNAEYLFELQAALNECCLRDSYIEELACWRGTAYCPVSSLNHARTSQ
jgi:ChaC-like protein